MIIRQAKQAIIYLRVSTEEQATEAYGLESQERSSRRFCEQRGWTVREVFCDPGVSGFKDVERPQFKRMMKSLREDRDANLVFFDYSRFGRKTLPALKAFAQLDKLGIYSVAVANPNIDCRTAAGRTARRTELSNAEDFSDQHAEKTAERMKAAFEDGRWCRPAPLGYRTLGTKTKGQPNLVPHEEEAKLIVRAFDLVALGHERPADVLRTMADLGLRSKKGNKLCLSAFLDVLRNPVYIGEMRSANWGTRKGLHKPIVDSQVFRNVQLILKGKKPVIAPYQRNREEFPLRRFLKCSECGNPLTGGESKSSTGKAYAYYNCYKCREVKSVPTARAAEQFLLMLERLNVGSQFTAEFEAVLREEWSKRTGDGTVVLGRLRTQLKEQRDLQKKLVMAYLKGDKNIVPFFQPMNEGFETEIASLEAQIKEAEGEKATFEQLREFSKWALLNIPEAWAMATIDQKQRVQNALFPEGLKYHPQNGILNAENSCLYNDLEAFLGGKMEMVRPRRFERLTYSFGGCCSIQLSYGRFRPVLLA